MITDPSAPAPLQWRVVATFPAPDIGRLTVTGDVDLATAPLLGIQLMTMMDTHRPQAIEIDVTGVAFLDCAGIGILVTVRNTGERTGCQIQISHPQPKVAHIFELLGLLELFTTPIDPPPASTAPPAVLHNGLVSTVTPWTIAA